VGDQTAVENRTAAGDERIGIVHGKRPLSLRLLAFGLFVVERGRCARLFGERKTRRIFDHPTHRPVPLSSRALAEGALKLDRHLRSRRMRARAQVRSVATAQNKTRRLAASNRSVVRTSKLDRVWQGYDAESFRFFFRGASKKLLLRFRARRFNGLRDDARAARQLRAAAAARLQNSRPKNQAPSSKIRRRRFVVWKIFARKELRARPAKCVRP
jgi:hypothetical protein